MKHFLFAILFFVPLWLFPEEKPLTLNPLTLNPSPLNSPWTGGLNACQFGRMDLDQDGQKDLLVFDRHGNRLLCFINKGGYGAIDYQYTTEYDEFFPRLNDWAVFADYDGDGLEDIFTYSKGWAGIKVYRNVSTDEGIDFQMVKYPYLSSLQGGGEVNILATDADYPAIVDLDGDGDLDILTFGVMGNFLEKHLNFSMERYGSRDSLVFERTDRCWGRVAESEEDNVMYLDTCLFGYGIVVDKDDFRHRGATVTVRDLNGDGLLDLLLADVDYPGLTFLENGGDAANALMVRQMDYPPSDPVMLYSMPVPFFTDVNNDGVDDLLVSPFDPNPMASEGIESVWLYLNHGTNEHPDFQLYTKSFLQDRMIDVGKGAYPAIVDWDGDGLNDLVVGSVGSRLTYFKNVGTFQEPVFQMVDDDFCHLGALGLTGLVPAFADLDGDERLELLVGTSEGRLLLFDHDGNVLDDDYLHYDKPWSAPFFYDVDGDSVDDLVVGNATGRLTLFRWNSEDRRQEAEVIDFWGGVDVRDYASSYYGYSVPTLFYWGNDTFLAVGSESGKVFLFMDISVEENAVFQDVTNLWSVLCDAMPKTYGMRSSVTLGYINRDCQIDIIVGNFGGGLQLFNVEIAVNNLEIAENQNDVGLLVYPNPVSTQLHVVTPSVSELRVMDIYGRIIREQKTTVPETIVDVTDLAPGVYLLNLGLVNRIFLKR